MLRYFAVLAAFALSSPAFAGTATVSQASPGVLVNQGELFQPVQAGQVLTAGDRVMVPAGAAATITFDDGCQSQVQPETLVTIPATSPCAGGQMVTQQVAPGNAPTQVGVRPHPGQSWLIWTTAGAAALIIAGNERDDDTSSP